MLLEFQREFAAAIGVPAEGAMRVYRNTVLSGCVDALRANYPIVTRLFGDQMFEAVAVEYATENPPREPVLALYGGAFPDWLEKQMWIWDVAYVPDVARIERLYIEALFAADAEPLEIGALTGPDEGWRELRLALHPATRFDWLAMPGMSIWLAQREEVERKIDVDWQPEGVLLTRPALDVVSMSLNRAGHRFLFGIRRGEAVGTAAVAATTLCPETDIRSLFTSLVNAGAFAAPSPRSLP